MSNVRLFPNFAVALSSLKTSMIEQSFEVHTEKWQGMDISKRPEATMRELLFQSFQVLMRGDEPEHYVRDIEPNLPWADQHFEEERVSGHPINPGETWKVWPWGHSADKFRTEGEQYNHTYAERYWPKCAGYTKEGKLTPEDSKSFKRRGIRYDYGDLQDVVDLLKREPYTRQAYLPVFFPEDTGAVHGGRIPCTIGYHFLMRGNVLNVVYQIRSCDFYRHLRDDIYLTVRLLLWVLNQLRNRDPFWHGVAPGMFIMHISSLHIFVNDWRLLKKS